MGGSVTHSIPSFRWSFVRRDDNYEIYQNEAGVLAEKHVILNDPKLDEAEEMEAYYYRYMTNKPIVKAYKADFEAKKDFCSNYKNIEVFTEYMPYRLADVRTLSHDQGLYVLSESLRGFYELYRRLGAFAIDETLIGFNKDGQVKVWHSPNFAKNHFDTDGVVLMSTANPHDFDSRLLHTQEVEMVDNIWTAVSQYALFDGYFVSVMEGLEQFDFATVKEYVDGEISRLPYVPSRLRFEDKFGIMERSRNLVDSSRASKRNTVIQYR
jgi:hypothetical protein